jgi:hypothetical protein
VVTHPRVFGPPSTPDEACRAIERWIASPSCLVLMPGPHDPSFSPAASREANAAGDLAFDAQIVALCREAGVTELVTRDRDFSRFSGFRNRAPASS